MARGGDLQQYAACERQQFEGELITWRYVRLHEESMPVSDVLGWLIEQGYVRRELTDDPDSGGSRYIGWGSTYFAVPWEKSVER